jgi:hypothetical protein
LFQADLGRGFIAVALDDPVVVKDTLKLQEGLAQFLQGVEGPHPSRFSLRMRTKRSATPLSSGARTKAEELSIPRKASSPGAGLSGCPLYSGALKFIFG